MTRGRLHHPALAVSWAAAIVGAALGLAGPATAVSAAEPPTYDIDSSSHLIGTPKPYSFDMEATSGSVFIQMQRSATTGNKPTQEHFYFVSDTTLACESDLSSCALSDADALGPLGRIDLTFSPNGPIETTKNRCDDGRVYSVEKTRAGTLGGIFRIRTHTGYFGTIENKGTGVHVSSALPAELTKRIEKNVDCQSPVAADTIAGTSVCAKSRGPGVGRRQRGDE